MGTGIVIKVVIRNVEISKINPMGKAWIEAPDGTTYNLDDLDPDNPGSIDDYIGEDKVRHYSDKYKLGWNSSKIIKVVNEGYYGPAEIEVSTDKNLNHTYIGCPNT